MRTRELHPHSFFAFAERTQAAFDFFSAYLDAGSTLNQMPASFPVKPQLVQHARDLEAGSRCVFSTLLATAGEDASDLDRVIAEWREYQIASRERLSSRSAGRGKRQGYRNSDALRRAKVAYGLYLSLGPGAPRGAAADALNRGIPSRSRSKGVDDDVIRHAGGTIGGWARPENAFSDSAEFDRCSAICIALEFEYLVLEALWQRAQGHFGPKNVTANRVEELVDSGRLWTWREEAVAGVSCPPAGETEVAQLLRGYILTLKGVQRYRRRRPTAMSVRG